MKRSISVLLVMLLVLPAFAPWMPHSAIHALHDSHVAAHHGVEHHSHHAHDHQHSHGPEYQTDLNHAFYLDFVSYFKDYLHVDLKKPEHTNVDLGASDAQDFDQSLNTPIYPSHDHLAYPDSRAPPDYQHIQLNSIPVYLSTQRLRI